MAAWWALLRTALLCTAPLLALALSAGRDVLAIAGCSSLLALLAELLQRRARRGLPFPVFLLLVYAVQSYSLLALPSAWSDAPSAVVPAAPTPPYNSEIRTMSIVIAAHNEHDYMARTLDSIYKSTPPEVLREVIIVDDASSPPLAGNLSKYGEIIILRHEERKGLIKSKTEGGNMAVSDLIMFLDGHVKPEADWWRPIMRHANENYKRVVVPVIPLLDPKTWTPSLDQVGIKMMFDWTLSFDWFEDGDDLVPCMSGGLFGITRRWWHESGEYDYGMLMWGGENIEQSIRVWTCGGEIYVARDSKVGHVFRNTFPYEINFTQMWMNKVRAVEVWFDEYKENYYSADPGARQLVPAIGDISERVALRQRLQCKPFRWYVEKFKKVFASKRMLPEEVFLIRDRRTKLCLKLAQNRSAVVEEECRPDSAQQQWAREGKAGIRSFAGNRCLDANAGRGSDEKQSSLLSFYDCLRDSSDFQEWSLEGGRLCCMGRCVRGSAEGALRLEDAPGEFLARGDFEETNRHIVTGPGLL